MYYLYIRLFIEKYELIACYSIKISLIECESKLAYDCNMKNLIIWFN